MLFNKKAKIGEYTLRLLIIADDFTGALDTAVKFSRNSIDTFVTLYKDFDLSKVDDQIQLVAVDTESRHISCEEAALRVKDVVMKAHKAGVTYFYKKTDSALRGNIGCELNAIMDALDSSDIMFIPAYPDAGRTTLRGCHYIHGVPLNETDFARDPINPVTDCFIPRVIKNQAGVEVVVVGREGLHSLNIRDKGEKTVYVFDAERNDDLENIADWLKKRNKLKLTAGCAGFAGMLSEMLELKKSERAEGNISAGIAADIASGRMLTVCGSINELSLRQVNYAEKNGFYGIALNPQQKLIPGYYMTEDGKSFVNMIVHMINEGKDVVIKASGSSEDREKCGIFARGMNIDENDVPSLVSRSIGRLVGEIAAKTQLKILTVIGGDTAVEVVHSMGFYGIIPRIDIMTGVVLSEALGYGSNTALITKSGGFGDEDALVKIREYILSIRQNMQR